MQVFNALALAMVDATAKSLKEKGDVPANWLARSVVQKVDHNPNLGVKRQPSIKVNSQRGTFVRG